MSTWKTTALGLAQDPFPPGLRHVPKDLGTCEDGSDEWLDVRRKGVGASDSPSILGVPGAFATPLKVWVQKIETDYSIDVDDKLAELFHFGHKMEPLIADELRERTGYEVRTEPRTLAHPDMPFVRANLDSWVCVDGVWGPGEFKNSSAYVAEQWAEEAPLKYQVQNQHQMYVTGAEIGCIATLIGGNQFLWTIVERNDKFIDAMVEKLIIFWSMVGENAMPMAGDSDLELLKELNESDPEIATCMPFEAIHWAAQWNGAKEKMKEWEQLKRTAEAEIWQALGVATVGELPDNSGQFKVIITKKGSKYLRYKEAK